MEDQLNYLILIVKWKIYAKKQMGENIGWNHIKFAIKNMIETLSFIASKNDRAEKHERTWGEVANSLDQQ